MGCLARIGVHTLHTHTPCRTDTRCDHNTQGSFFETFSDEEVLQALATHPLLRSDTEVNILVRWATTIPFFKVSQCAANRATNNSTLTFPCSASRQRNLSARTREALAKVINVEHLKPGTVVCREGFTGNTFYVILSGAVKVRYCSKLTASTHHATSIACHAHTLLRLIPLLVALWTAGLMA